ncbi:MAG: AAA family ATPase [Myxococcota bacterium]|jgi:dTMP kinase|nr:AAA family ATPase [Myxococcota bacterium]
MKLPRPLFVVFEGLDGSGKSTCAALLAKRIDAELLTTPSPRIRRYRDELVDSFGSSQEARQLFYLATVCAASEEASALLRQGRSVVLDRYFLSTQAYAAFRGSRLELDDLQHLLQPADVTIYLDSSLATRLARLQHRKQSREDQETITAEADEHLREEHLRRSHLQVLGRFLRIAGEQTPEELLARVLAELTLAPTHSSGP